MRATPFAYRDIGEHPAWHWQSGAWYVGVEYMEDESSKAVSDWLDENVYGKCHAYLGNTMLYFELEQEAMMFYMRFS